MFLQKDKRELNIDLGIRALFRGEHLLCDAFRGLNLFHERVKLGMKTYKEYGIFFNLLSFLLLPSFSLFLGEAASIGNHFASEVSLVATSSNKKVIQQGLQYGRIERRMLIIKRAH